MCRVLWASLVCIFKSLSLHLTVETHFLFSEVSRRVEISLTSRGPIIRVGDRPYFQRVLIQRTFTGADLWVPPQGGTHLLQS